jgi:hypothetical protein
VRYHQQSIDTGPSCVAFAQQIGQVDQRQRLDLRFNARVPTGLPLGR